MNEPLFPEPAERPISTPLDPHFADHKAENPRRTSSFSLRHHGSMTLKGFTALTLLLTLPLAQAQTKVLHLLQQYTGNPETVGSAQKGEWSVSYMAFDTPLGFVQLTHLKGKPKAWILSVQEPRVDLLKRFPNKTSYKKIRAGAGTTEHFKVNAGPFKGDTLALVKNGDGSLQYSLITPGHIAVRDLTL